MNNLVERDKGFTIVELTVTVALMLVLVASILGVLSSSTQVERSEQVRAQALSDLRLGMQRLVKETRQAVEVDPSSTPTRLDMRTLVNGVERHVVYEMAGGTLTRTVDDGVAIPLVRDVAGTSAFCFDPPACVATAPPEPMSILGVSLTVAPSAQGVAPVTMSIDVHLRNARGG